MSALKTREDKMKTTRSITISGVPTDVLGAVRAAVQANPGRWRSVSHFFVVSAAKLLLQTCETASQKRNPATIPACNKRALDLRHITKR